MNLEKGFWVGVFLFVLLLVASVTMWGCDKQSPPNEDQPPKEQPAPPEEPNPEDPADPDTPDTYTFEDLKLEILSPFCLRCHRTGGSAEDFAILDSYQAVLKVVTIGDPIASPLFKSVNDGYMPPFGPLPSEFAEKIKNWIVAGAPEK